jgi:hypothetical protein
MQKIPSDYSEIVVAIRNWPVGSRIMLAQLILSDLEKEVGSRANGDVEPTYVEQDEDTRKLAERKARFDQAWGILRTDAPPPTDEEVERILEDARMEKYG